MHARFSSCLCAVAAGLALLLTGCDGGGAEDSPTVEAPAAADPSGSGPEAALADVGARVGPIAAGGPTTSDAGPPPNPNRYPQPLIQPTLARLTFTETSRDFGPVTDTAKHEASFTFVNTGPDPLVIAEVKASCSCTVPRLSKRQYAPGESGTIEVVFDPKSKTGAVSQSVTIISNSRDGEAKLTLSADVRPVVNTERYARLGVIQLFEEHRAVVPVTYTDPDTIFNEVGTNDPFITAKLVRRDIVESGEGDDTVYRADIELTVSRDHPWGGLFARRVNITVTGRWMKGVAPIRAEYALYLLGSVFGELHAKPQVAAFNQTKRDQNINKSIKITRPSGAPFKIERAWVTDSRLLDIDVRIEQVSSTEWRIVLTSYTAQNLGDIKATLNISTDVAGEELLQIPISGRVG